MGPGGNSRCQAQILGVCRVLCSGNQNLCSQACRLWGSCGPRLFPANRGVVSSQPHITPGPARALRNDLFRSHRNASCLGGVSWRSFSPRTLCLLRHPAKVQSTALQTGQRPPRMLSSACLNQASASPRTNGPIPCVPS